MTKLEVGKEYWFKGRVVMIDGTDAALPYRVEFCDLDTTWLSARVETVEVVPGREKVTIPKFVANWLKMCKNKERYLSSAILCDGINEMPTSVATWLSYRENEENFARAWLDGYEVEEPLYWVRDKKGYPLLVKWANGDVTSCSSVTNEVTQRNHKKLYSFTEKEIKDYDERYWAFAVPVEEDDE